jgi:hypothetical protein
MRKSPWHGMILSRLAATSRISGGPPGLVELLGDGEAIGVNGVFPLVAVHVEELRRGLEVRAGKQALGCESPAAQDRPQDSLGKLSRMRARLCFAHSASETGEARS